MLPDVAVDFDHSVRAVLTNAAVALFFMRGTHIVIVRLMPKGPGAPTVGPMRTLALTT